MQTKKVLIVGAGPGGLACAAELAKSGGFDVTVLEKNSAPSYKICGGGIDSKYIKAEVGPDILKQEFGEFFLITPRSSFRVGAGPGFIGTLDRKRLNEALSAKAIAAGAKVIYGANVTKIGKESVTTADGHEFPFDFLVGADGSTSLVRKSLGLKTEKFLVAYQYMVPGSYPKMEFHVDFQKFGVTYSWIFPQKDIISVGTGYAAAAKKPPEFLGQLRENFDAWCKERFDLSGARFEGFTINYDYRGFEFGNVFLIGDAAGFASGFTGEGIKPAITSGQDVAHRIMDPAYECANIKRCLAVKWREDGLLHALIHPFWGRLLIPVGSRLADYDWFKKVVFRFL